MVFSGEADESFYDMCKLLIANGADVSPEQLPAGAFNKKKAREFIAAEIEGNSCEQYGIAKDLNKVPEPDYREYFTTVRQMSYYKHIEPTINVLLESSRGCWWYRCTFCGHNPYTKKHRKKDHQKVLGSIASCGEKYGAYNIEFTDNILSMDYFDDLIPALATLPEKYKIFFEVKANLKKHHIEALVNANVKWVQAGLEGLHDEILKIQKKGTSTIINIETLKNALEYGLDIWWNVLCNFPGEDMKWYNDMAKDIPLFHHLQPPATLSPIVFVRFSDYFNNQEKFGLKLRPFESLKYIYSLSEEKILRLVSFFHDENYGIQLSSKNSDKYSAIHEAIVSWQKEFYKKHPSLLIMRQNSNGTI
jgi:magnesium-protoporphyrin IX monomethyl ester (oxidative) cyclase